MDAALYAPGLGYYSAGAHKLGAGGDFTTAPEVSRLFGACVARQCAEILSALGGGSILEIGAGSGRLAVDILSRLETLGALTRQLLDSRDQRGPARASAPALRAVPAALAGARAVARSASAGTRSTASSCANEVLDALPVARFRWHRGSVEELGVAIEDGRFAWGARPAAPAMAEICRRLSQSGGALGRRLRVGVLPTPHRLDSRCHPITCAPARRSGSTTACLDRSTIYRSGTKAPCCVISNIARTTIRSGIPGLQDITAWVDYTLLAEASRAAGFALAGFTTQSYFLAGLRCTRGNAIHGRRR